MLDHREVLLEERRALGRLQPDLVACGQLLHRLDHLAQQSCRLLTSQEKPPPGSDG